VTVIIVSVQEIITYTGILEMKRTIFLGASVAIGSTIAWTMLASPGAAQSPYNPYPDGILPLNVLSEIHRVQREVNAIFQQYLQQWQALPPPTVTGNPPTLQGSGTEAQRILGGLLN